ncbi:hypothetical protein IMZ16_09530 [Cruoricaptor ignavus]|uniref:PRTRC system protein F n=2 Tax=Cruoricaptor ignavus TaxID=1118202 RepID=A0A7M1T377_9FLAO|nr:hypothetical protein IMZ16_09530 [Cruoricaptor ignavus]
MNATKNYIGKRKYTRKSKTATTTPTIRRICRMGETPQRCFGDSERQTEICADKPTSDAFLKWTFLPKHEKNKEQEQEQEPKKTMEMEKECFQSLFQLTEHYGIKPKLTQYLEYPYNIALVLDDIQKQLKFKTEHWEEIRLVKDKTKNQSYFISEERFHTGSILYYIPILPLYRLSKNPKRKQASELLKSVCSYLYHIAEVPYYRQQSSYLFWMYEMITDWIASDEQNEEQPAYLSEIKQAEQIGEIMEKKIYNSYHLTHFKNRLKHFKAKDVFDNDCWRLASKVFSLYEQYPNTTIFRNATVDQALIEDDEQENILAMNQYISFCADAKGVLFETLFETVNSEFQECNIQEEPIVSKHFNGKEMIDAHLDFERRLFPLIEELIYILNSF